MSQEQQFHVPEVPRNIYSQDNKFQIADEIISYIASKPLEYVPYKGILIHIQGATYPKKGFPTPEAIGALNIIKYLLKEITNYPVVFFLVLLFIKKERLLSSFNTFFNKTFAPYKLSKEYLCPAAYTMYQFLNKVLQSLDINNLLADETAYNLSHIVEYDDSYRFRLQDIAEETNYQQLKHMTRKEIKRLLELCVYRESGGVFPRINKEELRVAKQMRKFTAVLLVLLAVPKIKRAFVGHSHILQGMRYDEADRYWAYLKHGDYQFGGKVYEERTKGWDIPTPYKIQM